MLFILLVTKYRQKANHFALFIVGQLLVLLVPTKILLLLLKFQVF